MKSLTLEDLSYSLLVKPLTYGRSAGQTKDDNLLVPVDKLTQMIALGNIVGESSRFSNYTRMGFGGSCKSYAPMPFGWAEDLEYSQLHNRITEIDREFVFDDIEDARLNMGRLLYRICSSNLTAVQQFFLLNLTRVVNPYGFNFSFIRLNFVCGCASIEPLSTTSLKFSTIKTSDLKGDFKDKNPDLFDIMFRFQISREDVIEVLSEDVWTTFSEAIDKILATSSFTEYLQNYIVAVEAIAPYLKPVPDVQYRSRNALHIYDEKWLMVNSLLQLVTRVI